MILFILGSIKMLIRKKIKGGFHENSQYLDWAEMLGPMRPLPEPPP